MTHIYHTLIIGTGFGGLCMGAKLKERQQDDFIILEKAHSVGGTWRENTYPGAECDVPSALYSYSFAQNPTWDFKWAKQKQILGYLEDFAKDRALLDHVHFDQTVTQAVFDEDTHLWTVSTQLGKVYKTRFLVSAVGQLHHPNIPDFPGKDSFQGPAFHSAQWDHSVDLTGKSVAVIGNAASAVQLIPEVAKIAGHVTVYQRSANWVINKGDRPYSRLEKALGKAFPPLTSLYRAGLWCLGEFILYPMIKGNRLAAKGGMAKCKHDMRAHIKDPTMQAALTPTYPIGAKRILFSDKYYEALARDNVSLETDGIGAITVDGITTQSGMTRQHDVIVYATGFQTNPFLQAIDIYGEGGQPLREHWTGGAQAYLGVMTAGFPNLFMLFGPNTNTGHTSIIYKLEAQVGYILKLMDKPPSSIAVDPQIEADFNTAIQTRLKDLVWNAIDASWYKDGGKVTNNWPGSSREYKRRLKTPIWDHFIVR